MLNLVEKNKEMLLSGVYTLKDQRQMLQISTLKNINDYDLYLIACCLCNYKIPEIEEAIDLRQIYYEKTNFGKIDSYEHPVTDYGKVVTSIRCTNTGNINKKYGSYEFEINCTDDRLISDLWAFKNKDCLKYVDSRTYPDKIIVSIGKEQLSNFKKALDYLMIGYDSDDLEKNLFYQNKSENTLVDLSTLSLPFTPYDFQLQDAEAIVKKKRVLLGHDMGCVGKNTKVRIQEGKKQTRNTTLHNLYTLFAKNKDIKVKSLINGRFGFIPIKDVLDRGIQKTIKICTTHKTIECTPDHLIYTKNGWKEAINITTEDELFVNGKPTQCINCGATKDLIKLPTSQYYGYCRKCSYALRDSKWHTKNKLVRKLDKCGYVRLSGELAKSMPNYDKLKGQGGIYEHHQVWYEHTGHIVDTSIECVHHKNGIKTDNRFENLELLLINDHRKLHGDVNAQTLPQNSLDYVISRGNKLYFVPQLEKVVKIEQGQTQTVYDIVLDSEEIHNFVCNGIVVHNCGKSFISVLVGESIKMPKLVICPESLRLNWYKEIKQVVPNADVQIQLSNEEPHFGKDWTIVGYLTVSKYLYEFMQFKCIFVDEAHNCKAVNNWGKPTSKRALSVITLAENAEYCYLLSGTPLPSHNKDLFNIMKMLKCEEFDFNNQWAFKHFADKFCDPKETRFGKDYSGNSNSDVLHNYLSNLMVRRRKKEVLPNLKKQRQFIPVHPKFKKEYKDVEARIRKPQKGDTYMGLAMTGRMLLSQYKIETAIDLAESLLNAGESVVLVTNFIETADILKQHFKDDCVSIVGGMSDEKKQKAIDKFQKKEATVCVLNIAAGGVGITLTASHTMIIIDYAWMPTDMIQVEDRICRSGQTEPCMIYYIYCDNAILDNLFIEMISNKSENIDTVVDNVENTFDLTSEKESSSTFITKLILHLGLGVT